VHRLAIHCVKVEAFFASAERNNGVFDAAQLAVWDGDAIPYTRAPQLFPVDQNPDQEPFVYVGIKTADNFRQFTECGPLICGF